MLKIWGRNDGSNVIKALWCLNELGVEYERIDWGGEFGGNDDPEYRAKNPNGRLPTLEEEDGFTLWESGAVVRYLCARFSMGNMCPASLRGRADAEKWMDWSSLNLAPFNSVYLQHFWRLPEAERSQDVIEDAIERTIPFLDILDAHLADNDYMCGDRLTSPPACSRTAGSTGRRTARRTRMSRRGTRGCRSGRPTRTTSSR